MGEAFAFQALNRIGYSNFASPGNHIVDASNEGIAWVFQSETSDPISHLFFRYGSRTGTPPTYQISLQTIDASTGVPTGTVLGGASPASGTLTPPASTAWDSTGRWVELSNPYSPSIGEVLAIVIEYSSGTIDGSNNSSFTRNIGGTLSQAGVPFCMIRTAGTWSKQTTNLGPFGYRTSTGRYGCTGYAAYTSTVSGAGNRSCAAITLPSGFGSTFTIAGIQFFGRIGTTGQTAKVGVWNAAGTELTSVTMDAEQVSTPDQTNFRVIFPTPFTGTFGTTYYYGVERLVGSVGMYGVSVSEAEDRQAWPLGENRVLATWNGSAWTEVNTVLPWCDLIFDDITTPSGSGGTFLSSGVSQTGIGVF